MLLVLRGFPKFGANYETRKAIFVTFVTDNNNKCAQLADEPNSLHLHRNSAAVMPTSHIGFKKAIRKLGSGNGVPGIEQLPRVLDSISRREEKVKPYQIRLEQIKLHFNIVNALSDGNRKTEMLLQILKEADNDAKEENSDRTGRVAINCLIAGDIISEE